MLVNSALWLALTAALLLSAHHPDLIDTLLPAR